jgi:hypothetical protein
MKRKPFDFEWSEDRCDHCGARHEDLLDDLADEIGATYGAIVPGYVCPRCGRDGCPNCMPGGRNCLCPECEE